MPKYQTKNIYKTLVQMVKPREMKFLNNSFLKLHYVYSLHYT